MSQRRSYSARVIDAAEETMDAAVWRLVKLPVELRTPKGFDPDRVETWPRVEGRMEYVGGRLLYMPPCGEVQSSLTARVVGVLMPWARVHQSFWVGTNEAGVALGGDRRGADAAVYRRRPGQQLSDGFAREAPALAVEVEGKYEGSAVLRRKARWYLEHGTEVVWLVLQKAHEIVVVTRDGEARYGKGETIPEHPALPGLVVSVDEIYEDL